MLHILITTTLLLVAMSLLKKQGYIHVHAVNYYTIINMIDDLIVVLV